MNEQGKVPTTAAELVEHIIGAGLWDFDEPKEPGIENLIDAYIERVVAKARLAALMEARELVRSRLHSVDGDAVVDKLNTLVVRARRDVLTADTQEGGR